MASCLSHRAGYWCTRSIKASPIVVVHSKDVWNCFLVQKLFLHRYTGVFCAKNMCELFLLRYTWGFLCKKYVWTVSPQIYRGLFLHSWFSPWICEQCARLYAMRNRDDIAAKKRRAASVMSFTVSYPNKYLEILLFSFSNAILSTFYFYKLHLVFSKWQLLCC